jgi:hypothetical protein
MAFVFDANRKKSQQQQAPGASLLLLVRCFRQQTVTWLVSSLDAY